MRRTVDQMTTFELSRWSALYDAVNFVADECQERGINFATLKLEPLYIRKYVESTCDTFAQQIETEDKRQANIRIVQEHEAREKDHEKAFA